MNAISGIFDRISTGRALIIGMMIGAIYYFMAFDQGVAQKNAIAASQAQMLQLEQQIRESQVKLDRAAFFKKTASEVGTTINKLLKVIPENFKSADMMKIMSNEVKVVGSSLTSIIPQPTTVSRVAKEFEELAIQVDATGTFQQHMLFFSNLTRINQILTVRRFELTMIKEGSGDTPPSVRLNAEIVAYRYIGEGNQKEDKK